MSDDRLEVAIAVTTMGTVSSTFAVSLAFLYAKFLSEGIPTTLHVSHIIDVASARRALVKNVLDMNGITHILWLDGDILLSPEDALRLLEDRKQCRVVGGLYRKRGSPYPPVVCDLREPLGDKRAEPWNEGGEFTAKYNFDLNGLTQVGGMGQGCLLVETDIYREMEAHFGDDLWYVFDPYIGEDLYFFKRLHEMGVPVWLDGLVRAGHETMKIITVENGWVPEAVLSDGRR